MNKNVDPKMATIIIVVVVIIIGGILYWKTSGPGGEAAKIINAKPTPEEFQQFMKQGGPTTSPQGPAPAAPGK